MDTFAYGISIYCAGLLGSAITYKWLAGQATEDQKRDYSKGWLFSIIGFGIFMLVIWLLPEFLGTWGLVIIPFALIVINWMKRLKTKRTTQPPATG